MRYRVRLASKIAPEGRRCFLFRILFFGLISRFSIRETSRLGREVERNARDLIVANLHARVYASRHKEAAERASGSSTLSRTNYFQPCGNMVGEGALAVPVEHAVRAARDSVIFIFHSRPVSHYLADRGTANR